MEIIYGFDPLCGWCYGFTPAFARVREELAGEVVVRVATGGLVSGERRRAVRHDAGYLRAGLARVREVTGVAAGPGFEDLLRRGDWVSDSEPCAERCGPRASRPGTTRPSPSAPPCRTRSTGRAASPTTPPSSGSSPTRRASTGWWSSGTPRNPAAGPRGGGPRPAPRASTHPSLLLDDGTGRPWRPLVVGPAPAADVVRRIRAALAPVSADRT